jgi:peroxiredoxin
MARCSRLARLAMVMAFAAVVGLADSAAAAESLLGKKVDGFQLPDAIGKDHSLADLGEARVVVVVFVGTECPLAKLYAPRLNHLAGEYADRGVRFVAVDSNLQDSPAEIAAFVKHHDLAFPMLKDSLNKVADEFGATRTPEAFVLDDQRVVRYHGRIDDQYGVGVAKAQPGRRDLALAIDELLEGKQIAQAEQPAVGCFIGRVRQQADAEVTYSRNIARIFQDRCVECHRAG